MAAGANFPTLTYHADFGNDPNSGAAASWTDLSTRVLTDLDGGGGWRLRRGRSFEFGHADPGELDVWLRNDDGALTPLNASSPYVSGSTIRLMRQFQIQAAYGTNLLARNVALFTEDASGWAPGANTTVPAGHDLTRGFGAPGCLSLTALAAGSITATMAAAVPVTAALAYCGWIAALAVTTPRAVSITINWLTAAGAANGSATVNVGNDATVWTQFASAAFGVAPASTTQAKLQVTVAGCALGETHCFDLAGLFQAASVAAWTPPAGESPYNVYTGYVERWPQLRDLDGVYPVVKAVVVDALSPLAGVDLLSCYDSEVLLDSPYAFYPCGEAVGATAAGNISGQAQLPATAETSSKANGAAGSYAFGYSTSTPIAYESPAPTALGLTVSASNTQSSAYLLMPFEPLLPPFMLEVVFRVDALAGGGTSGFLIRSGNQFSSDQIQVIVTTASGTTVNFASQDFATATLISNFGPNIVGDGKWHHLVCGIDTDGKTGFATLDGVAYTGSVAASPITFRDGTRFGFGGIAKKLIFGPGFTGAIAKCAVYPRRLTAARITAHYQAFSKGFSGESTDARVARILNYVPWNAGRNLLPGATTAGACLGLSAKTAGIALTDVGDSDESGVVFVDGAGRIAFRGRHYAQAYAYPRFIFGENEAAGEIPYLGDVEMDFDIEQVTNTSTVTRQGGATVNAVNTPSMLRHFPRAAGTVTVNTTSDAEVNDRANWLVADTAYGQPRLRVSKLTFKPSNLRPARIPLAWWAALSLEVGDPVRVMARPPGGAVSQVECVVDEIVHTVADAPGEWEVELHLSPLIRPWLLAGLRTTLNASSLAAATTLVLNPLPDAATNPAEAALHVGALLTVQDPGLVEQVGVVSVTSSAPGLKGYATVSVGVRAVTGAAGTLAADLAFSPSGTSTVSLVAASPSFGLGFVIIDGELMGVTAGAGTSSLTVTRGPNGNGCSQAPHAAGATVTYLASTGAVNAHAVNTLVSEPLSATPDGRAVADPYRWDTYSVLGALATTARTVKAIGATTLSLPGPTDWPSNVFASALGYGDTLVIRPAGPNLETVCVLSSTMVVNDGSVDVTLGSRLSLAAAAAAVTVRVLGGAGNWIVGQTVTLKNAAAQTETKTITTVTDNNDGTVSLGVAALTFAYQPGDSATQGLKTAVAIGDVVCEPLPSGVTVPAAIAATALVAY